MSAHVLARSLVFRKRLLLTGRMATKILRHRRRNGWTAFRETRQDAKATKRILISVSARMKISLERIFLESYRLGSLFNMVVSYSSLVAALGSNWICVEVRGSSYICLILSKDEMPDVVKGNWNQGARWIILLVGLLPLLGRNWLPDTCSCWSDVSSISIKSIKSQ